MTEFYERAQKLEQEQRDDAWAAHQLQAAGLGLSHCQDCGREIPAGRRAAVPSCSRCFACQQDHEERNAR